MSISVSMRRLVFVEKFVDIIQPSVVTCSLMVYVHGLKIAPKHFRVYVFFGGGFFFGFSWGFFFPFQESPKRLDLTKHVVRTC